MYRHRQAKGNYGRILGQADPQSPKLEEKQAQLKWGKSNEKCVHSRGWNGVPSEKMVSPRTNCRTYCHGRDQSST